MPIDPRIALGYQAPQIESPINMMLTAQKMQAGQQENALQQAQMAEYQRKLQDQNALRATLAGFTPDMGAEQQVSALQRGGHLAEARLLAESLAKTAADKRAEEKSALEAEHKRLEMRGQVYGSVAANPTLENAQSALQYLLDNKLVDPNNATKVWQQIQDNPSPDNIRGLAQRFQTMSLSSKDQLEQHFQEQNLGASVRTLAMPKYGPGAATVVSGSEAKTTPTPGQELINQRLREKGVGVATPLLSQAILDKRVPISRVNSRTAPLFEAALQIDPEADLSAINISQLGAAAGARTAGTTTANIEIASDEANRMIGVLRDIIPTVNLTNYPSINAVQNAVSRGTGGIEVVKLNTAINSLINAYARAINPRGQPTVSDKNHAREVINAAMSKGQLAGALEVMEAEMRAALEAATAAGARRGKAGGEKAPAPERGAPPSGATPATNAKGWVLHTDKNGNQAYVSPDGKQFEEVK